MAHSHPSPERDSSILQGEDRNRAESRAQTMLSQLRARLQEKKAQGINTLKRVYISGADLPYFSPHELHDLYTMYTTEFPNMMLLQFDADSTRAQLERTFREFRREKKNGEASRVPGVTEKTIDPPALDSSPDQLPLEAVRAVLAQQCKEQEEQMKALLEMMKEMMRGTLTVPGNHATLTGETLGQTPSVPQSPLPVDLKGDEDEDEFERIEPNEEIGFQDLAKEEASASAVTPSLKLVAPEDRERGFLKRVRGLWPWGRRTRDERAAI